MQDARTPEFTLERPLASALATVRAVVFSPRRFFAGFSTEGPLKEPALFVLLVGAVTAILGAAVSLLSNVLFGTLGANDLRAAAVDGLLFMVLSPVGVGVAAAVYLLSIRAFVGKVAGFAEVYRIVAYAYAAFALSWVPVLGSLAITYALLILMGVAIQSVYKTSFLTAVITALAGFIPVGTALVWITLAGLS